jgi:uncharacterized protein
MSQAAKAQEPSMEEILASIRRIIADDDTPAPRPEAKAPEPPPAPRAPPLPKPAPAPAATKQDDIDAMLAGLDEAPEPAPPPAPKPPPEPEPADVLELTEAMQAPAPAFRTIDGTQDVVFDETEAEPAPRAAEPAAKAAPMPPMPPMPTQPIISSATAAAVDSAFNALAHTVLVQNAKTLEDLVKEMLRPMLQHWLDNNLPTLVERLVRQEIERVARGRS